MCIRDRSFTTITGRGCRAVSITGNAVGGGRRSSLSCRLISRSETTFVGIRFRTINVIRIRVTTVITIGIRVMAVVVAMAAAAVEMAAATVPAAGVMAVVVAGVT